jgi:hypothetical protein
MKLTATSCLILLSLLCQLASHPAAAQVNALCALNAATSEFLWKYPTIAATRRWRPTA